MSYSISKLGRAVFVRWQTSTLQGLGNLRKVVFDHHASLGGQKLIYVSVSGDDNAAPEDGARRAVVRLGEEIMEICDAFYVVVEATGFRGSILRSALAGMMMLSRKGSLVHVEDSTEGVARAVAATLGRDPELVVQSLRNDGIILKVKR